MPSLDAVAHAAAGAAAGMIAMALLYPLENVRTRLQVQVETRKQHEEHERERVAREAAHELALVAKLHHPPSMVERLNDAVEQVAELVEHAVVEREQERGEQESDANKTTTTTQPSQPSPSPQPAPFYYAGTLDCIRQVCEREGWHRLYAGLGSAVFGVGLSSAVYFFWYQGLKTIVLRYRTAAAAAAASPSSLSSPSSSASIGALENVAVATVAGVLNVFVTSPIWVVNTRITLAARNDPTSTFVGCVRHILQHEGVAGFYRGLVPSLLLVSNPVIQFVVYEQLMRAIRRSSSAATAAAGAATAARQPPLSAWTIFWLGAISKAVATYLTYPTQVLKSRLQVVERRSGSDSSPAASPLGSIRAVFDLVATMHREEGLASFYRGLNAKLSQTVLNNAIMFVIYERLAHAFMRALQRTQLLQ